ncbi:MAG: SusC/RagA family TonB-linked outer membrane protein [Sphingobacteriaceae bacterium]|nr:SusC/RagA family TonB-linked outer membrane protein [Sphingobacteriaceae bacterium]
MKQFFILIAFVFSMQSAFAQEKTLRGTVTDASGAPLPGTSVTLKGETRGVVTDADGNFSISVAAGKTLVISFIGYESQNVVVKDQTNLKIKLKEGGSTNLDEVVVTSLGLKREKKALNYAVANVNNESLLRSKDSNVSNALAGKVAGLGINQAGTGPMGSTRITIRGSNSLQGNNQPLVVVDGVPINSETGGTNDVWGNKNLDRGSGLADIVSDDIENVSVLKGAAAAALYGSRAGNGVIMITTKKGSNNKSIGINVSSNATFDSPMAEPEFQNTFGQGQNNAYNNDNSRGSWGGVLNGKTYENKATGTVFGPFVSAADGLVTDYNGLKRAYASGGNSYSDFLRVGSTLTNQLDLSTGGENHTFRASLNRVDNKSMIPNSGFERTSFSVRSTAKLSPKWSTDVKANLIYQNTDNRPRLALDPDNIMTQMLTFPRSYAYSYLKEYEATGYGNPAYKDTQGNILPATFDKNNGTTTNPYWSAYKNTNNDERYRGIGMASLKYDFNRYFNAQVRSGVDYSNATFTSIQASGTPYWQTNGNIGISNSTRFEMNNDLLLSYNRTFDKFGVSAIGGANMRYNKNIDNNGDSDNLQIPGFYQIGNSIFQTINYNQSEKKLNSVYGSASLSYDGYAYLDVTARNDWSSTLPSANRSYFYPSVGGSFVATEFLARKNITVPYLSFLKLRGSWAQVGMDADAYQLQQYFDLGHNSSSLSANGRAVLANPNLLPERITSYEFGFDSKFLNNKIGFEFTFYNKDSEDGILQLAVAPATGYTSKLINAGKIRNRGLEIQLDATPVKTADFNWNIALAYSVNKNSVISLAPNVPFQLMSTLPIEVRATEGGVYGELWGTDYKRTADGNIIVNDAGLPLTTNSNEKVNLGSFQPDFIGGITNSFEYKNFNASFLVDVRYGGKVYMGSISTGARAGTLEMTMDNRFGGSLVAGSVVENKDSAGKGLGTYSPNTKGIDAQAYWSNAPQAEFVYDATTVRMREVSLGYSVPKKMLAKSFFKTAKLSAVARNLFNIYSAVPKGFDSNAAYSTGNVQGVELNALPTARSIGFNVSFGF